MENKKSTLQNGRPVIPGNRSTQYNNQPPKFIAQNPNQNPSSKKTNV